MTSATQLNTSIAATIYFKLFEYAVLGLFQPNALVARIADGNPLDMYIVTTDCYTIRFVCSLPKIQNRFLVLIGTDGYHVVGSSSLIDFKIGSQIILSSQ